MSRGRYATPKRPLRIIADTVTTRWTPKGYEYEVLVGICPFIQDPICMKECRREGTRVVEVHGPFYAVLEFDGMVMMSTHPHSHRLCRTPVFGMERVPMCLEALAGCIKGMEWVGAGLLDGKWEFRKGGNKVTVWPLFE